MNLPLIDGAYIIDNSGLERLKCPCKFNMSEVLRRVSIGEKAGANFGSTMHKGWETRYRRVGVEPLKESTHIDIQIEMLKWLTANPQPFNEFRNYNHACKMMDVYNKIYPSEQFKILTNNRNEPIIEASFMLPFGMAYQVTGCQQWRTTPDTTAKGIPLYYSGKIDLGIQDHNGVWSFDHKTAFQFGDAFDKDMGMNGGQLGYCWALGQTLGVKPQGYIIDAVRVRKPKRSDEFTDAAPCDATDFKRMPFYVSQDKLDEWKLDVLTCIADVFNYAESGYWPRHRWNCVEKYGVCEYYEVCDTTPSQRSMVLNSGLYEENKWMKGLKV
jgi:hypothetical protein